MSLVWQILCEVMLLLELIFLHQSHIGRFALLMRAFFPVISADKKVEEYFQNTKNKKNLYATYDPYVFSMADIIIVDINLDVQKQAEHIHTDEVVDYSVDISGFKAAIKSIGENCKEDALILIETTVPAQQFYLQKLLRII